MGLDNVVIAPDDPRGGDVRALLGRHLSFARKVTPASHVHALDIDGLLDPAVAFFSAREHGELLGIGALKRLTGTHAELKSMHTGEAARGRGIGQAMVHYLLDVATGWACRRVSLETGTSEAFAPARRLYRKAGFVPYEPFAGYSVNPLSTCMTIELLG